MTRKDLIEIYKNANYQSLRASVPRPREWHLPIFIYQNFKDKKDYFNQHLKGNKIEISLDKEDFQILIPTLLHESLFSFYKGFYTYLSAKNLYEAGALHWINITGYYAKLFLAQSINTICGKRKYVVKRDKYFFLNDVFRTLKPYKEITNDSSYCMTLDFNISTQEGRILFSTDRFGSSHNQIWNAYAEIDHTSLGLTKMTYDDFMDKNPMHLSNERNVENYTFEGFMQVDFNLDLQNFSPYFDRALVKEEAELVYDDKLGIVLGIISEFHHLYKDFEIERLPIEPEKYKHMVQYMISNEVLREKLIDLVERGFPKENEYIDEMHILYSDSEY